MGEAVIKFQAPNPHALRQETKDERRDRGLKSSAHSHSRRRIPGVDHLRDATRDQFGAWRGLNVSISHAPDTGHARRTGPIARNVFCNRVVESGIADIARLKIDDANG